MATQIAKFHKVTSLPVTLVPDSFYFVSNGTIAESYLTDSTGIAKSIGNSQMIQSIVDASLAGINTIEIVANITERDALNPTTNITVLVLDASADSTVTSWAAQYAYRASTTSWIKLTEYESLDLVIDWADIQNKPASSVADIDDAVNQKHSHTNKVQLDKIGEDANGDLTYNSQAIGVFNTKNW